VEIEGLARASAAKRGKEAEVREATGDASEGTDVEDSGTEAVITGNGSDDSNTISTNSGT
jgi:hypothetical protein